MRQYEYDLRRRLRDRRERLYATDARNWGNEARKMVRWMRHEPYLKTLLAEVESSAFDVQGWRQAPHPVSDGMSYPPEERARAKVCLALLEDSDHRQYRQNTGGGDRPEDSAKAFVSVVVDPLVDYLQDRIEDGGSVLGVLERYKRRTEWFYQAELYQRYMDDPRRGEANLDSDLRKYLVDQGIAFPFSQPRSPSGEVDIVALGGEPLTIEVKLFLPKARKDRKYIRQGFSQARRYARDYGLPIGYLVVFNLSDKALLFAGDDPGREPASVVVEDRTVFCIGIDINPERPSASRDPELARYVLDRDFLAGTGESE